MSNPIERDVTRWLNAESSGVSSLGSDVGVERALFLDLRSDEAFQIQRLEHSVNIPFSALQPSLYLLPPRTRPFAIILDSQIDAQKQLQVLCADFKGHTWTVTGAFVGDHEFFITCSILRDERVSVQSGVISFQSMKRLWEPSSALERWLPRCEPPNMDSVAVFDDAPDRMERCRRAPVCVDLGSGVGRDAVWAARRGWRVVAIDSDQKGLDRCARLAKESGVGGMVSCVRMNLGEGHTCTDVTSASSEDLLRLVLEPLGLHLSGVCAVYAVRFLHKPLVCSLAHALPPGASLLWFHFMRGCENTVVGRPSKDKDLLENGELLDAVMAVTVTYSSSSCCSTDEPFSSNAVCPWDVLVDDVLSLPDGRPISEFVAVKKTRTDNNVILVGDFAH